MPSPTDQEALAAASTSTVVDHAFLAPGEAAAAGARPVVPTAEVAAAVSSCPQTDKAEDLIHRVIIETCRGGG